METDTQGASPTPAEAATLAPAPRGFCHICDCEVVPRELADGSFECPRCSESCVECPYDSFHQWEGAWQVQYANGYANELSIDENGVATLGRNDGGGSGTATLAWAPRDHEGFDMRLEGHFRAGVREHLRRDPESESLQIRHETEDGTVIMGSALQPKVDGPMEVENDAPTVPGAQAQAIHEWEGAMNTMLDHFVEITNRLVQGGEAAEGGEAAHFPGLSGPESERMLQHLRQAVAPLAGAAAQEGPLMQMARQVAAAHRGGGGAAPPGAAVLAWAADGFFSSPWMVIPPPEAGRRAGLPEVLVRTWLDSRTFDGLVGLEPDWQCPICFDGTPKELVAICKDDKQRAVHAFHRECVAPWLQRRDECPTCRRAPVVTEAAVAPQGAAPAAPSRGPTSA